MEGQLQTGRRHSHRSRRWPLCAQSRTTAMRRKRLLRSESGYSPAAAFRKLNCEVGQPPPVAARFVPFAAIWRINGNRQLEANGCRRQNLIANFYSNFTWSRAARVKNSCCTYAPALATLISRSSWLGPLEWPVYTLPKLRQKPQKNTSLLWRKFSY